MIAQNVRHFILISLSKVIPSILTNSEGNSVGVSEGNSVGVSEGNLVGNSDGVILTFNLVGNSEGNSLSIQRKQWKKEAIKTSVKRLSISIGSAFTIFCTYLGNSEGNSLLIQQKSNER